MSPESTIPTPATPDVCTIAVLIDGAEIPGRFQIVALSVSHELNRIPSAVLQLLDGEASRGTFEASDDELFVPGKEIEIQLGYRSTNDKVFSGLVIKQSLKIRKNGSFLSVECRGKAVRMTRGLKSRYFEASKESDVMEEIIGAYELQSDVTATTPEPDSIVQYESTDWDFLLCRAEANGMVVMAANDSVTVAPPDTSASPAVTVRYGATVLELDAELDARVQESGITASAWNPADQELVETEAAEPSTTGNGNLSPSDLAEALGGEAAVIRHGGNLSQPELQAWADARLAKERLAKVRGRVRFQGLASILPGQVIEVTGIGARFEGNLYVSGVRHTVSGGNWETDVQFGLDPELFPERYNLRPLPASGLLPGVGGLQMGVVTVLEGDPESMERIKVRLPMISAEDEGVWARLATLDAGDGRGTFFRPEIGDEVVVGFIADDPRHPVVLGMCHSTAKPSPEAAADTNHRKGYVSREKLMLTFDDDKKIIHLETPGGNKLSLSEDDNGILVEDMNGNKITLDDKGITIESASDIVLKAAGDLKAEGVNIELAAQSGFKAEGAATAELSGASTELKGSATAKVSGGMVQIN
ncbi:MAG: type VI secretion system tip protein VgrG [Chlorobiaceae bacterium]|nr:type VI secretion system tip protein VgrG [Chlorobiaceae bacterium]